MKTFFTKFVIYIFLIFFCQPAFAQTVLTINSCDTLITDPNPLFNGSCTITIKSLTTTGRLAYNVQYFDVNYSSLSIYNGPNNTSPLITTLGDITIPNQLWGGQTTGNTITLQFFGVGPGPVQHFKLRIRCVEATTNHPVFQPLKNYNAGGNIKKADYDNDGDEDLVIGGKIFRNDSYFDSLYLFERKANVLNGWDKPIITTADFDNDGFKDVFITGSTTVFGGLLRPLCAVYRNNGNGSFTLATTVNAFEGANRGGCSIIDFNNDGKPDICYTGSTHYYLNSSRIFKIYLNNGNMNFTDANASLPGISGLINASMSWADSDGDGDKDLLINGHDGTNNICNLFTVSGTSFNNQNLLLQPTSAGQISWADINMDGKPDIINTGVATADNINAIIPEIFFNNGTNTFTAVTTNLPKLALGSYDLADYDGDNDLDIVLDGVDFPSGNGEDAGVFKNNGNGQFSRVGVDGAKGSARVKWVDLNNDGKIDIAGVGGLYIKNMGADSFKISSFTSTWRQYGNAGTLIEDFNNDGYIDQLVVGALADVDCNSNTGSTLVLGRVWRLSGLPVFKEVANLNTINPYPPVFLTDYYWRWADFDSDGKADIVLSSEPRNSGTNGGEYLILFKNNGNDNFSVALNTAVTPLPDTPVPGWGRNYRQVVFMDIDNDGINELLISSNNTVYKRVNNAWQFLYTDQVGGNPGTEVFCADVADYNNDGFADLAVSGSNAVTLYKNNKTGRMVFDAIYTEYGIRNGAQSYRQVKWDDFDNDGDKDLLMTDGILENRNDGTFLFVSNQISQLHAGVADFNGDGFKDFIAVPSDYIWGSLPIYYNEQGTLFFEKKEAGTPSNTTGGIWNQAAESFDIDNDGDNDFVFSGSLCNTGAAVVVNEGRFTDRMIHVATPNGAENLTLNAVKDIKWNGYQIGTTVKIEISRDSGISWQTIAAAANSSAGGGTYTWTVTGSTSTKCLVRVTDNANVTYTDKSDAVFSITVPPVPIANAGRDTILCKGQSTIIGSQAQANSTYAWTSSPVGFVSSASNPQVQPVVSTIYYLTVSMGALVSKDTVVVNVSSVSISLPDNMPACIGKSYTIGVTAQAGFSYTWSSLPVGFTSTVSRPSITPLQNTVYYLSVKNNGTGCVGTDSISVKADSCAARGFGVYIYPNPTTGILNLDGFLLSRHWQTLEIYDMQKRLVMPETDIRGQTSVTINVENLFNGVYFLRVINLDGGMLVFKFIKK